ncbi:HAD family hydrolase [Saliphagus infecundisoli]|uniref:HAD family hydrolase n=1 Tax=Saliphagus infecundisoli TaxID=1849069 RepID=A0ABD5QAI1_9EURY|nr:HAD family phosphatase [Saliphagus infecundisoli]
MKALIFDMDGVVVNSVGYWNEIREEIIRDELGVDNVDVEELVGMNADDEYDYLAEDHTLQRSKESYVSLLEDRANEIYRERVSILADYEELLAAARESGFRLGLVSASYRTRVEMVLNRFDLDQYFDAAVAGDDITGPSKPEPAIYEHAVSLLKVEPEEAVTVEDSEHGVTAAKGAGLYCIGYAHHPGQPLEHADETVETETELRERLHEICRTGSV